VSDQESAAYLNALARAIHAGARAKGFYDREFVADPESRYDNAIPNPSFPAEKSAKPSMLYAMLTRTMRPKNSPTSSFAASTTRRGAA
jgi:hypothetical protein